MKDAMANVGKTEVKPGGMDTTTPSAPEGSAADEDGGAEKDAEKDTEAADSLEVEPAASSEAASEDTKGKPEIKIWIPATDPEAKGEDKEEGKVEWQELAEMQKSMELGSFQFKAGSTMILIESKIDGKWPRKGGSDEDDWKDFKVGSKVDVEDTVGKWLSSTVKDTKEEDGKTMLYIHYDNYDVRWDEWIESNSERVAKHGTKASKERASSYSSYSYYSGTEGTPSTSGIVGLRNLGNTCFMNSTLQCMMQTPWLTQFFTKKEHLPQINKENPLGHNGRIAEEFGALVGKVWSDKYTVVAPSSFKQAIGEFAPQFSGYNQQDSQELLSFLVDGLHEDLNRLKKKEYDPNPLESKGKTDTELAKLSWDKHKKRHDSAILDHMGGMFRSKVVCPVCNGVSRKFDPFLLTLPVPLPVSDSKRQEVTVVFADPKASPTKYTVDIAKSAEIGELKTEVASIAKVDSKSLVIAEVFSNKIYKQYKDRDGVGSIMDRDIIFAFECPKAAEIKEWVSIPIHHVHKSTYGAYDHREFGDPRVLVLDVSKPVTRKDVAAALASVLGPSIEKRTPYKDSPVEDQPYTAVLKSSWESSPGAEVYEEGKGEEEMDVTGRDIILSVYWGEEEEAKAAYKPITVIDDESCKPKEAGGKGKSGVDLVDCLQAFTKEEKLKEGNEYYCKTCKKLLTVTKKMDMWKLPDIMAIQLKRFQYTQQWRDKIDVFVDFPLEGLDMAPHTLSPEDKKNALYDLYAVSCHGGGLGGGHYWAYVKNHKDGNWYNMNDSSTGPMRASSVKTSEAYLLFYVRRGFGKATTAETTSKTEP